VEAVIALCPITQNLLNLLANTPMAEHISFRQSLPVLGFELLAEENTVQNSK
jgi:hypothetical protein